MERLFRQDFSTVSVQTGQADAMGKLGATAVAKGEAVTFAQATPDRKVVAHELAHVVQHRQALGGSGPRPGTVAATHSAPEREAERVAERIARGEDAGEISARPVAELHRHAPFAHEFATVTSLADTFASGEIALTYVANFERDFSQGNPKIASAANAWTALLNEAPKQPENLEPWARPFRDAVMEIINGYIGPDALGKSLGGYQTWEHMDQPDHPELVEAELRWAKRYTGLAGYLQDTKAYIKDQLVASIDVYRMSYQLDAMAPIDNWGPVARPKGYVAPSHTGVRLPEGYDDPRVTGIDAPFTAARRQAEARQTVEQRQRRFDHVDFKIWEVVGQHLGRAMHSLEDFWAHSNWVALAKAAKAGGGAHKVTAADRQKLLTGTFDTASQAHALGHKLVALSSSFLQNLPMLLKIYGRSAPSHKLDSAKTSRSTRFGGVGMTVANDRDLAYQALEYDSFTALGEISDVGDAANNVEELVRSGNYEMADFLTNPNWLEALRVKGFRLIAEGDKGATATNHVGISTDQPEDGKDFGTSLTLSTVADRLVFGPLRAVMDEADPKKAHAATERQLGLLDRMLEAPTPSHPLWALVPGPDH